MGTAVEGETVPIVQENGSPFALFVCISVVALDIVDFIDTVRV